MRVLLDFKGPVSKISQVGSIVSGNVTNSSKEFGVYVNFGCETWLSFWLALGTFTFWVFGSNYPNS